MRARETRESRGAGDSGPSRNHRMPVYPWRSSRRLSPWRRLPPPHSTSSRLSKCRPSIIQQQAMTSKLSPSNTRRPSFLHFLASSATRIVESSPHAVGTKNGSCVIIIDIGLANVDNVVSLYQKFMTRKFIEIFSARDFYLSEETFHI